MPSVVTSRVTSSSGTSTVASALVSPITSPISSIVPIRDPRILRNIDPRQVEYRSVTSSLIEEIEALHFRNNPLLYCQSEGRFILHNLESFILSEEETDELTSIYEEENPDEFNFEPAQ